MFIDNVVCILMMAPVALRWRARSASRRRRWC
jgi:hypothetical protein